MEGELGVTPPSTYDVGRGIAADVLGRPEMWRTELRTAPKMNLILKCGACGGRMFRTLEGSCFHYLNGETYCPSVAVLNADEIKREDLDIYEDVWE